jgi:hypothetical protein
MLKAGAVMTELLTQWLLYSRYNSSLFIRVECAEGHEFRFRYNR